jgi:hypothetical protein
MTNYQYSIENAPKLVPVDRFNILPARYAGHQAALSELGYQMFSHPSIDYVRVCITYDGENGDKKLEFGMPQDLYEEIFSKQKILMPEFDLELVVAAKVQPIYAQNQQTLKLHLIGTQSSPGRMFDEMSYFSLFQLDHRLKYLFSAWSEVSQRAASEIDYQEVIQAVLYDNHVVVLGESGLLAQHLGYAAVSGLTRVMKEFSQTFQRQIQPNEVLNYYFTHFRDTQRILEENQEFVPYVFSRLVGLLNSKSPAPSPRELWLNMDLASLKSLVRQLGFSENGFLQFNASGLRAEYLEVLKQGDVYLPKLTREYYEEVENHKKNRDSGLNLLLKRIEPYCESIVVQGNVGYNLGKQGACPVNIKIADYPHLYDLFTQFAYDLILEVLKGK